MSRFEGALEGSRPYITIAVRPAPGQVRLAGEDYVEGLALVDTGSETSGITRRAAERLSLISNATMPITTVLGEDDVASYTIEMKILFNAPTEARDLPSSLRVFEDQSDWPPQMSGIEVVGLLGMDVLQHCQFDLDGPSQTFELSL